MCLQTIRHDIIMENKMRQLSILPNKRLFIKAESISKGSIKGDYSCMGIYFKGDFLISGSFNSKMFFQSGNLFLIFIGMMKGSSKIECLMIELSICTCYLLISVQNSPNKRQDVLNTFMRLKSIYNVSRCINCYQLDNFIYQANLLKIPRLNIVNIVIFTKLFSKFVNQWPTLWVLYFYQQNIKQIVIIILPIPQSYLSHFSMGSNVSSLSQSTVSCSTLMIRYELISKDQDKNITIVKEKQSQNLFIIKETVFIEKSVYERHLCRFNHLQQIQQSENTLNLKKVWTEEHNTLCANTYKIFPMYEFSNVTLKDQLDARYAQNKAFEQEQLLGMIQACLNSLNSQSPFPLSLEQIYIAQDGLLKTNNADLFDQNKLQSYYKGVYYSPEKMQNFDNQSLTSNPQNLAKQSVFGLGLTLLNCIFLQDLSEKLYNPLNSNKKMRFNHQLLQNYIQSLFSKKCSLYSQKLSLLIQKMLDKDPKSRLSIYKIQQQLDQVAKSKQYSIESQKEQLSQYLEKKQTNNIKQQQGELKMQSQFDRQLFKVENISTIYDKNGKVPSTFRNKDLTQNSQLEILKQITSQHNIQGSENYKFQRQQSKAPQFYVPLVKSTNLNYIQRFTPIQSQKEFVLQELPSPVSEHNPLFTNPQFLARINDDIKSFGFTRKPSYASTQISRQYSNGPLDKENSQARYTFSSKKQIQNILIPSDKAFQNMRV